MFYECYFVGLWVQWRVQNSTGSKIVTTDIGPCVHKTFWDRCPVSFDIEFHILTSIFTECVHKKSVSTDMEYHCGLITACQYFVTGFQSHLTLVLFSFVNMYFEIDFRWHSISVSVDIDIGCRTKVCEHGARILENPVTKFYGFWYWLFLSEIKIWIKQIFHHSCFTINVNTAVLKLSEHPLSMNHSREWS